MGHVQHLTDVVHFLLSQSTVPLPAYPGIPLPAFNAPARDEALHRAVMLPRTTSGMSGHSDEVHSYSVGQNTGLERPGPVPIQMRSQVGPTIKSGQTLHDSGIDTSFGMQTGDRPPFNPHTLYPTSHDPSSSYSGHTPTAYATQRDPTPHTSVDLSREARSTSSPMDTYDMPFVRRDNSGPSSVSAVSEDMGNRSGPVIPWINPPRPSFPIVHPTPSTVAQPLPRNTPAVFSSSLIDHFVSDPKSERRGVVGYLTGLLKDSEAHHVPAHSQIVTPVPDKIGPGQIVLLGADDPRPNVVKKGILSNELGMSFCQL
jgi:hypothetical protein